MDVLSDVLSWLRVKGTLSRRSEFSAPWGIAYPAVARVSFLSIEQGSCFLLRDGQEALPLASGDLVMFSPGSLGALVDRPSTPTVPYAQVLDAYAPLDEEKYASDRDIHPPLEYGGGGQKTVIRGWGLRFESHEHHPLLSLLPPYIHVTYGERNALPWLETTVRFLSHETHHRGDGSDMMIVRLVELMFVQLLRAWFGAQGEGEAGWLGGLRDGPIRQALKLIHRHPGEPWTVKSLGEAVGMSRSNLAQRFQSRVGTSPVKYLTQVRMHLAANALKSDVRLSLAELSKQVGYDTESSFSRAFKRYFRASPGAYRRQQGGRQTESP